MEVFKAVEKGQRWGSNWAIFKASEEFENYTDHWNRFSRMYSKYLPQYFKGMVIEKAPGTVGILTFKYYDNALTFIEDYKKVDWEIIKVRGIGKGEKIWWLIGSCGLDPSRLFRGPYSMDAPNGTLAFEAVEVLE